MSTVRRKPNAVQWLCINQPLGKIKSLIWVLLMCRPAAGAYFDATGVVGSITPYINGFCISSSGTISLPSLDPTSMVQNLGATTYFDLDVVVFGLNEGTCVTGTIPFESITLFAPHCHSGGVPLMYCNPGTSTIMRCSEGEILWVGAYFTAWTGTAPITDGWYVGHPRLYSVSPTDMRGNLVTTFDHIFWGAIDPETAANSTVPACECDATQCDIDALIGFKCENAFQKSCPASSHGPGGLVSASYYKVAFSMIAIMLYQM